jgi:hypothetical protein
MNPVRFARKVRGAVSSASGVELLNLLPGAAGPIRWLERRPALHGLVLTAVGLRRPIFIDYPVYPHARYGHGRPAHPELTALLARGRERYADRLRQALSYGDQLSVIPLRTDLSSAEPSWLNGWLPPLDALALYSALAAGDPRRYVEIGSGNSTKFARRAITDHGLRTVITSIDPAPRAHIDALCDRVIRSPLEHADLSVFDELEPGDIVFFDGSHRSSMGSDVNVFFLELLPRLPAGVLVQIHDILLPDDYPPQWAWRHYNEQYLLAAFLLADAGTWTVELPNAYVHGDRELRDIAAPLWERLELAEHFTPASFWLSINARSPREARS